MAENAVAKRETVGPLAVGVIESVLIRGDLAKLNETQRLSYYQNLCHSLNLNSLTKPFEYIQLNGRLVLYATRSCTDQLRSIYKISIKVTNREQTEEFYKVTAEATTADGRTDESMGVVTIIGLKGDALANALMKAETKAKRRVALSICGLGFLDDTERETVDHARPEPTAEEIYDGTAKPLVYTVPFGKYKDRQIDEIGEDELKDYVAYIMKKANEGKKDLVGDVKEFVDEANGYLEELVFNRDFKNRLGK